MPIYEYQCQACEHKMEALQKMADAALIQCPACEQDSLKKLISAVSFKLTGSGWYETDFKNNNKPQSKDGGSKDGNSNGEGAKDNGPKDSGASQSSGKSRSNDAKPAKSGGGADKAAS